jgi:DICT domain-containing protein
MKDFSMFEQTLKIVQATGIDDLGFVPNVSRREFDGRQTFACSAPSPAIEYLSLLIENMLLLRTNRTGRVYAGFGKLSQMEPVVERYLRIADVSERVYIFGEADWTPPRHPNMKLIETGASGYASREWFIIADSSNLRVALVARSEEDFETRGFEARACRAIKSSDPAVVTQLAAFAEGLIDTSLAA